MPMIVVPDSSMESLRELVATLASTTELVDGCFIKRRLRDQLCSIGKDRYSDITYACFLSSVPARQYHHHHIHMHL